MASENPENQISFSALEIFIIFFRSDGSVLLPTTKEKKACFSFGQILENGILNEKETPVVYSLTSNSVGDVALSIHKPKKVDLLNH
jgi:hypothetical protein